MRFRLTLLLGMAVGYVLGAKAGHERYNQILEMWRQFQRSDTAQQVSGLADQAVDTFQAKASEGVAKANEALSSAEPSNSGTSAP